MQSNKKYLIVICGPTAVGKTAVGINLAQLFDTEIVSADSRQFFKEMNIGTAKPTEEELQQVKHHFIGNISIDEEYNAGIYETEALIKLEEIYISKNIVFLVGGSGLYINALCDGIDEIPKIEPSIRNQLNLSFKTSGLDPLLQQLKILDPDFYLEVDRNNPIRVIRALEVCLATGTPFSSFRKNKQKHRPFQVVKIGLNLKREMLYERINQRVDMMMDQGLEHEVRFLISKKESNALRTVGYSELFDYFENKISFDQSINLIKQHTRNFAKRQLTWFKKDITIQWFEPSDYEAIVQFIQSKIKN